MKKEIPPIFQHHLEAQRGSDQPDEKTSGITFRAVSIGAFLSLFIGAAVPYTNMIIKGTVMAHNFSTPAALFVFFVFAFLINTALALLSPRFALSRSELAVVYIMAMLATSIPTIGFTENLLPIIAGLYYYATPENKWQELIHPHVPKWIVPQDTEAITYFYEGLPPGMALPWNAWIEPLFYWCLFILSFYWVSICMMTILRKQWVEYEKLPYPLVQVPLEMIQDEERAGCGPNEKRSLVKPYFRNRVMWVGFALPFLIGTANALSGYFPFLPHIDTHSEMRLFRGSTYLRLDLNLGLIGFAYLLSRDVALGFWFFFLLSTVQRGVFNVLGIQSTETLSRFANSVGPYLAHQAMGAMIVLVLSSVWMARRHLQAVYRKVFNHDRSIDDSDEIISYRTAVWGLLAGLGVMGTWLWQSGLPLWVVPVFLFGMTAIFIAITRAVAEGGISVIRTPLTPADFVISGVGTSALGSSGLTGLAFTYVWSANIRIFFMPCFANALKLAEEIRGSKRGLLWAVFLALIVTLLSSVWSVMTLSYKYGGINLHEFWFVGVPRNAFNFIAPKFVDPVPASMSGWGFTALGAVLMGLLTYIRYHFVWWPIHPLGFATGTFNIMNWVWFSIFTAWVLKSIILKYGGSAGYLKTRPFFLGLILGQVAVAGLWLIIDGCTGKTGNVLGYF